MRIHCWLIAIAVLAPSVADAQITTADGVRALIRGDYATAAHILRPLAEDAPQPDPLALFFMASLYHAGHGVATNPIRACGLYLRAATPANPLLIQAVALARTIHLDDPVIRELCDAAAAVKALPDPRHGASLPQAHAGGDDAVDAYLRANYQGAAQILKPIAESWPSRDHVAEFFMATLYETGRGVPADPARACALYVRASSDPAGPFGRQAEALVQALHRSVSPETFRECVRLANLGFDHGFQPATFTLEDGHWIALDLDGATITYRGMDRRIPLGWAIGGSVFLPIEHTELTVAGAQSTRRHFIEFFTWIRSQERTSTLIWRVFEVVRDDLVAITTQQLTTSAERPPSGGSFDVHAFARLRVNDNGRAEWTILRGPNQGTGVIESDAERRERSEQARARTAAEARVDWTRVFDAHRLPALTYSDANGCADVFVYGWSADRTEVIAVRADKDRLGLSTAPHTFDIASNPLDLELVVHVFERPVRSWPFCTDVVMDPDSGSRQTWKTTGGTVTIELSPPGVSVPMPSAYRATIHIVGAEFVSAAGVRVKQTQPITLTAVVGWYSG